MKLRGWSISTELEGEACSSRINPSLSFSLSKKSERINWELERLGGRISFHEVINELFPLLPN